MDRRGRQFFAGAERVMPDTLGWIVIQPDRGRCAVREVDDVVASVHSRIELWNRAARDEGRARFHEQTADLAEHTTALGI